MTFEEMKKDHDHYDAYKDWVSVVEAKKTGLIPKKYHKYFPDTCDCGSENIIKIIYGNLHVVIQNVIRRKLVKWQNLCQDLILNALVKQTAYEL